MQGQDEVLVPDLKQPMGAINTMLLDLDRAICSPKPSCDVTIQNSDPEEIRCRPSEMGN
jgi:hypothetical protein